MTQSILERLPQIVGSDYVEPKKVLVVGASGGIGGAFCQKIASQFPKVTLIRMARNPESLGKLPVSTQDIAIDISSEQSIEAAVTQLDDESCIDWCFIATGWLHDDKHQPEKSYRALSAEQMSYSFQVNALGPSLLLKALLSRVKPKHPLNVGILTARVGSISDNRMGGWHSYRASKAALNMLIKNFSIELGRMKKPVVVVGLQPGTTATDLSAPFQRGVAPENLQTPTYTASQLLKVMQALEINDSGGLYDFLGIPFEP